MEAMMRLWWRRKSAGMDYKADRRGLGILANNGIKGAQARQQL